MFLIFLYYLQNLTSIGNGWELLMIDLHLYDTINTLKENSK